MNYLEAPDCSNALAAAEVVAALADQDSPNLPDEVKQWVHLRKHPGEQNLAKLALKAIERIRTDSELKELWDDSDHKEEWYAVLDNLERRLKQPAS